MPTGIFSFMWLTFVHITGENENNSTRDTFRVCHSGKQRTLLHFKGLKEKFDILGTMPLGILVSYMRTL